jgi:hypothetical protein
MQAERSLSNLRYNAHEQLDTMAFRLEEEINRETDADRKHWLKQALKNVKTSSTFLSKAAGNINCADRIWEARNPANGGK